MTETVVLDLSGAEELCSEPGALERVRKAYAKLEPGGQLEVRSPVTEHAFAVRAWSRKNGVSLVVDEPGDGYRRLVLEAPTAGVWRRAPCRRASCSAAPPPPIRSRAGSTTTGRAGRPSIPRRSSAAVTRRSLSITTGVT